MAHERLHKYNTREAFPEQELDNDLCWIVKAGNHVIIRGQTGRVRGKDEISGGAEDPVAQTDNAMQNVKALLEEAGATLDDICAVRLWLSDRAFVKPVTNTVGKWLKGVHPTMAITIIKGFARPQYVMEIDVDVILPPEKMK
jgi:enamine deaminase RidA (YjgF/YER057c/UK114 family)